MWRREPATPISPRPRSRRSLRRILVEALSQLATVAEPEPEPPEIVPRVVTVTQQIAVLRAALGRQRARWSCRPSWPPDRAGPSGSSP